LQSNVSVGEDAITGTLKYVTGYAGFSSLSAEQSGNYLALKVSTVPAEGVTTTVELVGGAAGPVMLDSDMNVVLRVTNKNAQTVRVVATKGAKSITRTYGLASMTLETSAG
jgi:hypothetical protein